MLWLPSEPPSQADDVNSVSSDSMGEQLYELINLYNTGYTQKITGYHSFKNHCNGHWIL